MSPPFEPDPCPEHARVTSCTPPSCNLHNVPSALMPCGSQNFSPYIFVFCSSSSGTSLSTAVPFAAITKLERGYKDRNDGPPKPERGYKKPERGYTEPRPPVYKTTLTCFLSTLIADHFSCGVFKRNLCGDPLQTLILEFSQKKPCR